MTWLANFKLVMRSSVTALWEKVEDPERMLQQLVYDMEDELETVRQSVAGAIADEIQLKKKVDAARQDVEQWGDRAASALKKRSDEQSAKAALEQKVRSRERLDGLEKEYQKQKDETAKLHRAVRDLEDKIRQARQKQTLLVARLARADSTRKINQALTRVDSRSAFAQFSRLEQRVDRAEAMNEAYERLDDVEPEARELADQFDEQERQDQLEQELADLKERLVDPS